MYDQLTGEDSYQIATMGVQGLRVEIASDGPPPPDEPPYVLSLSPQTCSNPVNFTHMGTVRLREYSLSSLTRSLIPKPATCRPPPVLEMPATFNLELVPGQTVALDTTISSDELDMARMEDGTTVDGIFWGKLEIVHNGDEHNMEFSGTRISTLR